MGAGESKGHISLPDQIIPESPYIGKTRMEIVNIMGKPTKIKNKSDTFIIAYSSAEVTFLKSRPRYNERFIWRTINKERQRKMYITCYVHNGQVVAFF